MRHLHSLAVLTATVVVAIVFAGSALAQTPTGSGYGGQAGGSLGGVAGGQAGAQGGAPASQATGSLPFTGIDLALLVVGGLALTGVGAGLVRAGARK